MVWCDGNASESVLARYFDPKLGRFLTQDSFLGQIDEPPSLHRYLYALDNPTSFFDPSGHIARQILDQSINRSTDQATNWFTAGVKAFFKEAGYQTLDVISFGALHRQDKLVDKNLAGEISDTEYYSKTSWNVALSAGQAAMTLGTGGTLGATRGAATAWGAASGIVAQGLTDVGEVYATETKNLEDIRARDYLVAGAMGALGGYAGYKARGPARAGPSQAEKTGVIAEQGQSIRPEAPAPAAAPASTGDVNVQPAINPVRASGQAPAIAEPAPAVASGGAGAEVKPGQVASAYPRGRRVGGRGLGPRPTDPAAGFQESGAFELTPENLAKMEKGRPPIGRDGLPVELHHRGQNPAGPLDEMSSTTHDTIAHPDSPSRIRRGQFAGERARYWRERARVLLGQGQGQQ